MLLELSQNPPMSGSSCCPTSFAASCGIQGGGGVGTRPWWLALLACGGAYWPLAFEQGGGDDFVGKFRLSGRWPHFPLAKSGGFGSAVCA